MFVLPCLLLLAGFQQGQASPVNPNWYFPASSIERPEDRGKRVHTNWVQWIGAPPFLGPAIGRGPLAFRKPGPGGGFTAGELRSAYGDSATGQGIIAIVDAFDDPNALNDFNAYAENYGLPVETSTDPLASTNQVFQVVYASGNQPSQDSGGGWEFEESLDIEMAHAMAPGAKVVLVEADTNDWPSMLHAVDQAVGLGAKEVSMSWGAGEFSAELGYDSHFVARGVHFFAASGDSGGVVIYPSASPTVIACGGTTLSLDSNGGYGSETAWGGGGGGMSSQEHLPRFQALLHAYDNSGNRILVTSRATPDIAAVADPGTGVSVYDSFGGGGWATVGGTSVATPILAGMQNAREGPFRLLEINWLYGKRGLFHDITVGSNGYAAGQGYDFCTGMGSPVSVNTF